jgi:1,4-dihydroxy-2-naphthoate octaprenyltransferase
MATIKTWIKAFRLRTLPLSVSGVLMGSALALKANVFNYQTFTLALLTTLFLQILSNLANDYGDSKNGKDNEGRVGPTRAVQSGLITLNEMKRMIIAFVILSLLSGTLLIYISGISILSKPFITLLAIGLSAIYAAITYTIGKNPYGYSGWGDISVFIFFGLFSVMGTYFLFAHSLPLALALPATSVGLFSVGVLNINNMRDCENDKTTGKITIVVKMGIEKSKQYHVAILSLAILSALVFVIINNSNWLSYSFLIAATPLIFHLQRVIKNKEARLLDCELKKLSLTAFFFTLIYSICINL